MRIEDAITKVATMRAGGFPAVRAWHAYPRSLLASLPCSTCLFLLSLSPSFSSWSSSIFALEKTTTHYTRNQRVHHIARQQLGKLVAECRVASEETRVPAGKFFSRALDRCSLRQSQSPEIKYFNNPTWSLPAGPSIGKGDLIVYKKLCVSSQNSLKFWSGLKKLAGGVDGGRTLNLRG